MLYKTDVIADQLEGKSGNESDPWDIVPRPNPEALRSSGAASVDLRLGRWFLVLRQSRTEVLDILEEGRNAKRGNSEEAGTRDAKPVPQLGRAVFVPFGEKFVLHTGNFVLGTTLEWIRLPADVAGYITGRSSWGRRGLVIETAAGIHPGFAGCLTLEISNLGEIPIDIRPGMPICQVFFHATTGNDRKNSSAFVGLRRPVIGEMKFDDIAKKLARYI